MKSCKSCLTLKEIKNLVIAERLRCIKIIRSADPLEAVCQWENGDDIAFAVQKFLVKKLREEFNEKK